MIKAINKNGVIKVFNNLPEIWTKDNGQDIINFHHSTDEFLEALNIFDVIEPIRTKYQKYKDLEPSDFDELSKVFVKKVINFTPAEQTAIEERDIDNETDRIIYDGMELHSDIRRRIVKAYKKGVLSDNQIKTIKTFLKPAIEPLKDGDWIDAQALVNALPVPGNSTLLAVLNEVKNLIDSYIIDNNIII